ncbi:hypothetical protein R84B8_00909 [Treponema sp. R8-4-B8]
MKRYSIKCLSGNSEFVDILNETDDEYLVRFTRSRNGNVKTSEEKITRHLFNICVQTGYLNPVESSAA